MSDVSKSSVVLDRELEEEKCHEPSEPRIRCPLCGWSPRKQDKWFCTCGNEWNAFETGGVCPACLDQWTETLLFPGSPTIRIDGEDVEQRETLRPALLVGCMQTAAAFHLRKCFGMGLAERSARSEIA